MRKENSLEFSAFRGREIGKSGIFESNQCQTFRKDWWQETLSMKRKAYLERVGADFAANFLEEDYLKMQTTWRNLYGKNCREFFSVNVS